jgi:hypothetical protein
MAQFYGTVQGGRGQASRLGHKTTGLETTCSGGQIGVCSRAWYNEDEEQDYVLMTLTKGSGYGQHNGPIPHVGIICNEAGHLNIEIENHLVLNVKGATKDQCQAIQAAARFILSGGKES